MIKHNQVGAVNGLLVSLIMAVLFLIGAISFGAWAFTERQDYKDNVDQKIAVASEKAKEAEGQRKEKQFAEEAKKPLKTYNGPENYGALKIDFPKTWSGYVEDKGDSGEPLDGYFAPGVVPAANDQNSVFALRIQVVSQSYSQVLQTLSSQQEQGKLTVNAYALPSLPNVVGIKATGQLTEGKNVTMIVLPLRSQAIKIWTEGSQYTSDFDNNILPTLTFSP